MTELGSGIHHELHPIAETSTMLRLTEIKLPLDHDEKALERAIIKKLRLRDGQLTGYRLFKRSYDARKRENIRLIYIVDVDTTEEKGILKRFKNDSHVFPAPSTDYNLVTEAPRRLKSRPIVIGNGPCGMFAGLLLAQMGFRPIILERGKEVHARSQDTFRFWSKGTFDPESNAQFGEGGAGTFSDGKLYSRIKKTDNRGQKVLLELIEAGAEPEIQFVSKPHIGTFRLVKIVENIRNSIIRFGGEVRFEQRVEDIEIEDGQVEGVVLANGDRIATNHVVLAVGHSARDTFEMLHRRGVYIEAKPFSLGVRIEHPQSMVDQFRFGEYVGNPILGAADYKLVHHCKGEGLEGRSVYSFCMCPGGQVVAAASEPGRLVTNGMSQYERSGKNANSGLVVDITPEDFPGDSPLAGIELQRELEAKAFALGGKDYKAPGQLLGDFLAGRPSQELGSVTPTYKPGVHLCDLTEIMPDYAVAAIREAIPAFEKKMPGFAMSDAVLTGLETRTSSPIRIKRDNKSLQSLNTQGLYPAGEGAGYAGGILSAGVDGIKVAEAVAWNIVNAEQQAMAM